ncbi:UNVERIFIED_CONTAM: hypothetical protein PYX00_005921 [Menopon gallinae]|uniref:Uncharacterized protein n=1 Tax=Menopon gallinae TaxID=328185 RepID=A0AAW2HT32_9NEOP
MAHAYEPPHAYFRPIPLESHYEHGKGHAHNSEHWNSHGEKGSKGYSGYDNYDERDAKKYHKDHDSGFYKQREGTKKSHHDEGSSYGSHDESKKSESGESFDQKKSHKKGHKTTGYHNIYHKDEFKKQHSFYDEADGSGYYDKYGKAAENYGSEKGGYKKGDHLDSAYHVSDYGKKGGFDKGSFSGGSKGFHEIEGGNSHFSKNSEYGKKGGKSFHKGYGFSGDSGFDHER